MSNFKLNLPRSLLRELQTLGLNKGDRGELVSLVLLLLACDKAAPVKGMRAFSVQEFFKNLLNSDDYAKLLKAEPSRRENMGSDDGPTFQTNLQIPRSTSTISSRYTIVVW